MKSYILLVEDSQDDVALIKKTLDDNRILNDLVVLGDGAQASDFLFASGRGERPTPEIILLNFGLPKLSGLEVLEKIRSDERTRTIPSLILTSTKQEEDLLEGRRLGPKCYVRKPLDFTELVETIREMGLSWLIINQPASLG
ncbi:MAG: response regulator [Candidatus Eremiobacteraeota bacterium]|nr:response regulator [Candidatus Eremiobacteraeota bacterium]MBV8374891.1 response regulator [Candidatus Eremiobacteraeota bacterium]